MIFNMGYYTPLDREYGKVHTPFDPEVRLSQPLRVEPELDQLKLTPQQLGTSTGMMVGGAENLKSRIWHGASKVELAFIGAGKGQRQSLTPGSFGQDERQAMKDLARINKVQVSTHASLGVAGLSGYDGRGTFNEENQQQTLDEVKRAIDFAADATTGGAVVVHTGEFPRAIVEAGRKYKAPQLKHFATEDKKAIHYLVDRKEGKIIDAVREDQVIWEPVPETKEGREVFMTDEKGSEIKDDFMITFNNEARERAKKEGFHYEPFEERIPVYKKNEDGDIETRRVTYQEFKERNKNLNDTEVAQSFFRKLQESNIQGRLGQAREFESHYIQGLERENQLKTALQFYKRLKEESPEAYEKQKIIFPDRASQMGLAIPSKEVDPVKLLEQEIGDNNRRIAYGRETSVGGRVEARKIQEIITNATPIEEYGVERSAEALAELGRFAKAKTEQANSQAEKLGLDPINPIYIAPENLFPESYGSHPQELKKLIQVSRKKFASQMQQQGYDADESKELANQHIKATVDIGHANMWRKYWQGDPEKKIEEQDKDFKKWLMSEMKDLLDSDIIGHIHVGDNFGYHDEHVAPGHGNAPIKEFLKMAAKKGVDDIIVEPGSTNFDTMFPEALTQFGTPISGPPPMYGVPQRFDEVRLSYAGQVRAPYFMFPPYAPSEEWTTWSKLGLE
jgi:hypothetical protein